MSKYEVYSIANNTLRKGIDNIQLSYDSEGYRGINSDRKNVEVHLGDIGIIDEAIGQLGNKVMGANRTDSYLGSIRFVTSFSIAARIAVCDN